MIARRILWRWLPVCLALFVIAGVAAPYLSADGYGKRISEALEASLGRRVKIGKVRFGLFQGPGFTVSDVEIAEDPAFGVETFTWVVDSLDARVKLKSLWTGKIEWASLRLNGPIVNLVKNSAGHWNFEPLLTPRLVSALPRIEVRNARINFKFGDTKSIYYIGNVDLNAVARQNMGADWDLRFSGEPARTDRIAPMFRQSLTGSGRWRPSQVNLDIDLENSALSEISWLIFGRDTGIQGTVSSRVQLAGPLNNIQITGRLQMQELHRWDQIPVKGDAWPLDFRGRLDMTAQRLELESTAQSVLPIAVRYRVTDYLSTPRWAVGLRWDRFPVEPLAAIARHMGLALPEDVKLSGSLDGAVSWSGEGTLQGQIAFHDAGVSSANATAIHFDEATVVFDGDRIQLAPAVARTADSEASVNADYRWTTQELDLNVSSESMTIAALRTQAARLPAPLLAALSSGTWKGNLRYRRGPEIVEGWSGQVQLNRAEIPLPGLAAPLHVRSATVRLDGAKLWVDRMVARAGDVDLAGDYRYEPDAAHPHRFRLVIPKLDSVELERLLAPALRRDQGFLARTLGIGKSQTPDWLVKRFMEGTVEIGSLTVGDTLLSEVRSRIRWNATRVEFNGVEARLGNGAAYGRLIVDLSGRSPAYRMDYKLESMDFESGKIDAEGVMATSGTGPELLARIRSEGSFTARGLEIGRTASGCYRLEWPRLRLTELQLMVGSELFIGRGATQEDGRLLLQLSSGAKQMRIAGPLAQLVVEQPLAQ